MSQYLHVRCGPYGLLLALRHVVEVGDAAGGGGAWRAWRGHNLRVTDLCARLGVAATPRRQQVVAGDDGDRQLLEVDHVEGLREFDEASFAALDGFSAPLARLADAVVRDPLTGGCLLRLRHPVAVEGEPP